LGHVKRAASSRRIPVNGKVNASVALRWVVQSSLVAQGTPQERAEAIVKAHNERPGLLAEMERLRAELAALQQRPLIEVVIWETGEIVSVPDPRPPMTDDPAQAMRLGRLAGLSRPETTPDDGVDRRELHKRLRELKDKEQPS
jgi:hypothetical protein